MNQKKLWQRKWKNDPSELPPNNFAHRAYKIAQQGKHKTLLDLGSGKGQDALFFA
jgi:tRNA G46 methylase TrmB